MARQIKLYLKPCGYPGYIREPNKQYDRNNNNLISTAAMLSMFANALAQRQL
jgi:hypothetical protein